MAVTVDPTYDGLADRRAPCGMKSRTGGALDTVRFMSAPGSPLVVARPEDSDQVVGLLVDAFMDDPTWRAILVDPATRPRLLGMLWKVFADNAIASESLWLNQGRTAAAVWIPPDGVEMTDDEGRFVESEFREVLGGGAQHVLDALDAFEAAHPRREPHYTLSLLGTAPAARGHGHGLALLADTLAAVDEAGMPSYLEATNPVNVALYERYGFETYSAFRVPNGPSVTTMWRSAFGGA
jgi:GNAT superfamily N-acetyltransferase